MQFDLTKFLVCRAVAENADPDTAGADRLALLTSVMNMNLVQSALIASVLAQSQAQSIPPAGDGGAAPLHRGRRTAPMAAYSARVASSRRRVRVPRLDDLASASEIHEHLQRHKLEPRVHRETVPGILAPRVLRHWPGADVEVDEGTEVDVLFIVPEGSEHDDRNSHIPRRDADEMIASKRPSRPSRGRRGGRAPKRGEPHSAEPEGQ
jgi:hypothetical protein